MTVLDRAPRAPRARTAARVSFSLGRLAGGLSRLAGRGGGGTLPGKVALALRKDALRELTQDRRVVLVTGTNGKSTTTRFLAAAVGTHHEVVTNTGGANLPSGLVSALLPPVPPTALAVLEVDELVLPAALRATQAEVVVLLNLSRDQLDRVQEVASHVARWAAALRDAPQAHVVANADDPLVVTVVLNAGLPAERVTWAAIGSPWRDDASLCPRCAAPWDGAVEDWSCASCGLARPEAAWRLEADGTMTSPTRTSQPLQLALPGRASAADAVLAVAAAGRLDVGTDAAVTALRDVQDVDGRYLTVQHGGREVRLLLAKNPAGWLEILELLSHGDEVVLLGVNARTADGTDPSWLWDVPFEALAGRQVVVFGERGQDLAVRLHYAEVDHQVATGVEEALSALPGRPTVVAANYTAFTRARAVLRQG